MEKKVIDEKEIKEVEQNIQKKINLEKAYKLLGEINSALTFYMKYKKATQDYIEQETNRLTGVYSVEDKILELYNDPEFIKKNGRRRYYFEIGNIVGYSTSTIQQYFSKQKKTK